MKKPPRRTDEVIAFEKIYDACRVLRRKGGNWDTGVYRDGLDRAHGVLRAVALMFGMDLAE